MNFKRKKPRRWVRCVMCTPHRAGNSHKPDALKGGDRRARQGTEKHQLAKLASIVDRRFIVGVGGDIHEVSE